MPAVFAWLPNATLDAVFPRTCPGCMGSLPRGTLVCRDCQRDVQLDARWRCAQCRRPVASFNAACAHCSPEALRNVWSFALHHGPIQSLVRQIKYLGAGANARSWGRIMARRLASEGSLPEGAMLVPIPLHPMRERQRGYNQAALLARGLSARLGLPIATGLARLHYAVPQVKLAAADRRENLADTFEWDAPTPAPKHVLLVDDVFTTGGTMRATMEALVRAGTVRADAITLARALTFGEKRALHASLATREDASESATSA